MLATISGLGAARTCAYAEWTSPGVMSYGDCWEDERAHERELEKKIADKKVCWYRIQGKTFGSGSVRRDCMTRYGETLTAQTAILDDYIDATTEEIAPTEEAISPGVLVYERPWYKTWKVLIPILGVAAAGAGVYVARR